MSVTLYSWSDGKFYIKDSPTSPWLHLSYYKALYEMDLAMATRRAEALGASILETNPELEGTQIPMVSEGWCLHQMWNGQPGYKLVPYGAQHA